MAKIHKKDLLERIEKLEGSLSFILNVLDQHHIHIRGVIEIMDKHNLLPKAEEPAAEEELKKDETKMKKGSKKSKAE